MWRFGARKRASEPRSGKFSSFWGEDIGQDLMEYALLIALIGFMATASLAPVAQALNNTVEKVHKKFKEHVDHGLHKGWYK
jgi:hypothetical protein